MKASFNTDSPERGGALVIGGERASLPAAPRRQKPKELSAMQIWIAEHQTALEDIASGVCCCVTGYVIFVIAGCLP